MQDVVLIYTTWPDAETADRAARAAITGRHAACANVMAPIASVYRWEGRVETASETPILFKTTSEAAEGLKALLVEIHPYDTPCIVALPVTAAQSHPPFLAWICAETG